MKAKLPEPLIGSAPKTVCTVAVIDVSPSMQETDYPPSRLQAAVEATIEMINTKAAQHPQDYMGIVTFGKSAQILAEPEIVGKKQTMLIKAVQKPRIVNCTNIAAGLKEACTALNGPLQGALKVNTGIFSWLFGDDDSLDSPRNNIQGHIVLLSDGEDNCYQSPVKVAETLKNQGIAIDCIGIGGSPEDVDEKTLKAIASLDAEGRPRYRFIRNKAALVTEFKRLAGHICVMPT